MQNKIGRENKRDLLSIGEASGYLKVSIDTLRRWEKKGRILPLRSPGGHRYYEKHDLDKLFGTKYERVASPKPYVKKGNGEIEQPDIQIPIIQPITLEKPIQESPPVPSPSTPINPVSPPAPYVPPQPVTKPVVQKTQINKEVLSSEQQQKLDNLFIAEGKPKKKFDQITIMIIAVMFFAALSIFLFFLWQRSPTIISPVP